MDWDPLLLSLEAALIATLIAGVLGVALGAALGSGEPGRTTNARGPFGQMLKQFTETVRRAEDQIADARARLQRGVNP